MDSTVTSFLGFLDGMTYKGVQESEAITNCFYSGYALIQNVDEVVYIFENSSSEAGTYFWFQYGVHEPLHLALNSTVFYQ